VSVAKKKRNGFLPDEIQAVQSLLGTVDESYEEWNAGRLSDEALVERTRIAARKFLTLVER
jgi:hypothetical protein